jgi:CRISPR-associated protein Cmr3
MIKQTYLIESLAPLVFRSGKPFGSVASAQDATFPCHLQ